MKLLKLFLPGRFEDAFLYMGRLAVITEERSLRIYNHDKIVAYLQKMHPDELPVPEYLFARNDWQVSEQFKTLMRSPSMARGFLESLSAFAETIELDGSLFLATEHPLDIPAKVLLDLLIYNRRIYLGADTGLFQLDAEWGDDASVELRKPKKRLDARCHYTSAGYGTVNASCGNDGLFAAIDDFGESSAADSEGLKQIADASLRTGWMQYDVINYSSYAEPLLLRSNREKVARSSGRERTIVTDLGATRSELATALLSCDIALDSVQFSFNSNRALFVHTIDGHFYTIGIDANVGQQEGPVNTSYCKPYVNDIGRVLSASMCRAGLVVETEDEVLLFAEGKWLPVDSADTLAVRTFPRSKQYQNLVAITREDGLLLVSIFDDTNLVRLLKLRTHEEEEQQEWLDSLGTEPPQGVREVTVIDGTMEDALADLGAYDGSEGEDQ